MSSDRKSIPELSNESRVLAARLVKLAPGETISYETLSGLVGRDVTNGARGCLTTARRIILRDHAIATGVVRSEGVKRLKPEEIPAIGDHALSRIRSAARIGQRRTEQAMASDGIDNAGKLRLTSQVAMLGAVAFLSAPKRLEAAEDAQKKFEMAQPIPPAKLLEALRS